MTKSKKKRRKGIPAWARAPFEHFLRESERLAHVVNLSARGISMLRGAPKLIEALMKVEEDESQERASQLKNAQEEAKLAQQEVESGFPILHAWAIVGLWAHLESLIRTFIAAWLKRKPSAWRIGAIDRLRIRVGEYESIPKNQRHVFVAGLLERELGAGLKSGVTRFETLLEPFGLSGDLPECVKREIYEFGQARNVIAHRAGKIDRQFLNACPWFDAKLGANLGISAKIFRRYNHAVAAYVTLLICRIGEHYGVDMSEHRMSTEKKAIRMLSNKAIAADAQKARR